MPLATSAQRSGRPAKAQTSSSRARESLTRVSTARYLARHSPRSLAAAMEDLYLEVAARRAASMP